MKKWKIAGLIVCAMMVATLFPAAAAPDSLDSSEDVNHDEYQGSISGEVRIPFTASWCMFCWIHVTIRGNVIIRWELRWDC